MEVLNKYAYLFPFEKIPKGSKILIYGAGDVGQEYMQQILMTNYADLMGFIDRSYDKYPKMIVPIYAPSCLSDLEYDYIVLAFKTANVANDVIKIISNDIPKNKIIYQEPRNSICNLIIDENEKNEIDEGFAFEKSNLSIALKMGPQLGDAIIRKKVFCELAHMASNALFDIYAPNADKFINTIYNDQPQINKIINDGGAAYADNCDKYNVSLSVFYMISVDFFDYEKTRICNQEFADKIRKHQEKNKEYGLSIYPSTQNRIHIGRAVFKGWNCYTAYKYTDVFYINDSKVEIPFDSSYENKYNKLNLKKYITLNFGNGTTSKGNKHGLAKQWPWEYYNQFIEMFKIYYPNIEIVQLGDNTTECVYGADHYLFGNSLELVKYILKGAIFHLDIEGGLMHLASQIGTKCIVIYGPTQPNFFGYDNNINLTSKQCGGCYCLYNDTLTCEKGMDKPECVWSIKPTMVIEKVKNYLKNMK